MRGPRESPRDCHGHRLSAPFEKDHNPGPRALAHKSCVSGNHAYAQPRIFEQRPYRHAVIDRVVAPVEQICACPNYGLKRPSAAGALLRPALQPVRRRASRVVEGHPLLRAVLLLDVLFQDRDRCLLREMLQCCARPENGLAVGPIHLMSELSVRSSRELAVLILLTKLERPGLGGAPIGRWT